LHAPIGVVRLHGSDLSQIGTLASFRDIRTNYFSLLLLVDSLAMSFLVVVAEYRFPV
jgi:hypothetical protein